MGVTGTQVASGWDLRWADLGRVEYPQAGLQPSLRSGPQSAANAEEAFGARPHYRLRSGGGIQLDENGRNVTLDGAR